MKLSYPVKYAVLKVQRPKDYTEEQEIIGFVAAKCCLLSEIKRHYRDGKSKMMYEVVFTWNSDSYNRKGFEAERATQIILPEFNYYDQCYNSCIVEAIYDDAHECQKQADILNDKQQYKETAYLSVDENFHKNAQELVDKYNAELQKVKEFATIRIEDDPCIEVEDDYRAR